MLPYAVAKAVLPSNVAETAVLSYAVAKTVLSFDAVDVHPSAPFGNVDTIAVCYPVSFDALDFGSGARPPEAADVIFGLRLATVTTTSPQAAEITVTAASPRAAEIK